MLRCGKASITLTKAGKVYSSRNLRVAAIHRRAANQGRLRSDQLSRRVELINSTRDDGGVHGRALSPAAANCSLWL